MTPPGIIASELPEQDAREAIEEHFTPKLVPMDHPAPVYPAKKLPCAPNNQAERNYERAQVVHESLRPKALNDWARSRASTDNAHRIEVNES